MDRSSSSLKHTWHRVPRKTQQFLAARSAVKSIKISGPNENLFDDIVQEKYRKRADIKSKDAILVYAAK